MPYCQNCRTQVAEGVKFCPNCGQGIAQPSPKPSTPKWVIPAVIGIAVIIVIAGITVTLIREKESAKEYADVTLWVENTREISYTLTITIDERIGEELVRRVKTLGTYVYFPPYSSKRFDCTIDITSLKDYEINVALSSNPGYPIGQKYVHLHEGYNEIEIEV